MIHARWRGLVGVGVGAALVLSACSGDPGPAPRSQSSADGPSAASQSSPPTGVDADAAPGMATVGDTWRAPHILASTAEGIWFTALDAEGRAGVWRVVGDRAPRQWWHAPRRGTTVTRAVALGQGVVVVVDHEGASSLLALTAEGSAKPLPVGKGVIDELVVVGKQAFFAQFDGTGVDTLHVTDGTQTGTSQVASFRWSPTRGGDALSQLTAVNDRLWFSGRTPAHGSEPWTSDGTPVGTRMVKDVTPGPADSAPADFSGAAKVWFTTWSRGLQRSDGTAVGTHPVAAVIPWGRLVRTGDSFQVVSDLTSDPEVEASGTPGLARGVLDGEWHLWRTNGTPAATSEIGTLGDLSTDLRSVGVWSSGNRSTILTAGRKEWALWTTQGRQVRQLRTVSASLDPTTLDDHAVVGEQVFFVGADPKAGRELWVTDHSPLGTVRVADLVPGRQGSRPRDLTAAGETLWFVSGPQRRATLHRYVPTAVHSDPPSVQVAGVRGPMRLKAPALDLMVGSDQPSKAVVTGVVHLPGNREVKTRPVTLSVFPGQLSPVALVPVDRASVATAVAAHRAAAPARKSALAVRVQVKVTLTDHRGQTSSQTLSEPLV